MKEKSKDQKKRGKGLLTAFRKRPHLTDRNDGIKSTETSLLDLPMQRIICYLCPNPDRLAISATCKVALEQVELYCRRVLKTITGPKNCNVDDSFHERIRYRTRLQQQLRQKSTTTTDDDELPFRLLVQKALKTHLTRIGKASSFRQLVLSPSQKKLVAEMESSRMIKLFDLFSKECVATLDIFKAISEKGLNGYFLNELRFLDDDKVLFHHHDWICLWDSTVSDTHEQNFQLLYRIPPDTHTSWTWVQDIIRTSRDEFIFVTKLCHTVHRLERTCDYDFRSYDFRTKSFTTLFTLKLKETEIAHVQLVGIVCHKFLVFWAYHHQGGEDSLLYVYNLETLEQVDSKKGSVGSYIQQLTPNTTTFCSLDGGIHDLQLCKLDSESGKLSQISLFKVHNPHYNSGTTCILAVSETHVLIETSFGASGSCIHEHDLNPAKTDRRYKRAYGEIIAEPERSFRGGGHCWATMSTVQNKWYLSNGEEGIKVYLDREPVVCNEFVQESGSSARIGPVVIDKSLEL